MAVKRTNINKFLEIISPLTELYFGHYISFIPKKLWSIVVEYENRPYSKSMDDFVLFLLRQKGVFFMYLNDSSGIVRNLLSMTPHESQDIILKVYRGEISRFLICSPICSALQKFDKEVVVEACRIFLARWYYKPCHKYQFLI